MNIEQNIKTFDKLIGSISSEKRRKQIAHLIDEIGTFYFTSPAASKGYHEKYPEDRQPGGLLIHSLRVTKNLLEISSIWGKDLEKDSIITVGLFHDLGKAVTVSGKTHYVEVKEDWKLKKGWNYEYNPAVDDGLTHAQRSIRLLTHHGVELNDIEYLSILAHDGLYNEENICFKNSMNKLALLLHYADNYSSNC